MPERRKLQRRHLIYYLRVFDRNTDQLIGHLVDITPEGVMLISEDSIETDIIFQLRMVLSAKIEGSRQITFAAKSIWCKKDINPDFYDTGFQLQKVEPKDIEVIKCLVDELGFRD